MAQQINNQILTWPTFFTLVRICLTPFIVQGLWYHNWHIALILFSLAAFTDIIDGFLARWLQEQTLFGTYLDPVADKLLIISCFGTFFVLNLPQLFIPAWFIVLSLIKEALLLLGAWFCVRYNPHVVRPSFWGKLAMTVQSLSIFLVIVCLMTRSNIVLVFNFLLLIMSILMIVALFHYLYHLILGLLWIKN